MTRDDNAKDVSTKCNVTMSGTYWFGRRLKGI